MTAWSTSSPPFDVVCATPSGYEESNDGVSIMARDGRRNKLSCLREVARSPGDEALSFEGEQRLPVYETPTIPEGKDQPMTPSEEFTYQKDPLNISYHSQPYRRHCHRHHWKSKNKFQMSKMLLVHHRKSYLLLRSHQDARHVRANLGGSMTYLLYVYDLHHVRRILSFFPIVLKGSRSLKRHMESKNFMPKKFWSLGDRMEPESLSRYVNITKICRRTYLDPAPWQMRYLRSPVREMLSSKSEESIYCEEEDTDYDNEDPYRVEE